MEPFLHAVTMLTVNYPDIQAITLEAGPAVITIFQVRNLSPRKIEGTFKATDRGNLRV